MTDGTLEAPVEATYDIADIKQALAHAEREGRDGKILITPNGPIG
jgi:NADPH:quinone reductase-like Zn-dependent oxidoreductase